MLGKTIEWVDNQSKMADQTKVPYELVYTYIKSSNQMYDAIKTMIVRGAPAIGIAGAHGVALAAIETEKETKDLEKFKQEVIKKAEYINSSRPTAVNLA